MNTSLLDMLPPSFALHEIISYIDERFAKCTFTTITVPYDSYSCINLETNFKSKYKTAMYDCIPIRKKIFTDNKQKNLLLSKLPRKNGKDRYYLTVESCWRDFVGCECGYRGGCRDSSCGQTEEHIWYKSRYVGKSFEVAIVKFLQYPEYNEPDLTEEHE
jgi:hypothetical protein